MEDRTLEGDRGQAERSQLAVPVSEQSVVTHENFRSERIKAEPKRPAMVVQHCLHSSGSMSIYGTALHCSTD